MTLSLFQIAFLERPLAGELRPDLFSRDIEEPLDEQAGRCSVTGVDDPGVVLAENDFPLIANIRRLMEGAGLGMSSSSTPVLSSIPRVLAAHSH